MTSVEKGGIFSSGRNTGAITAITESSIDKTPKVDILGLTDEQNSFIQSQHKELLRYARDKNKEIQKFLHKLQENGVVQWINKK